MRVAPDVLLTDVVMPEMSGPQLVALVGHAELRVLDMSGYPEMGIPERGAAGSVVAYLQKPFTASQGASAIRRILDATRPSWTPPGEWCSGRSGGWRQDMTGPVTTG